MTRYFNRDSEKPLRRRLRNDRTRAEAALWAHLRGRQLLGMKFRRQYSVGAYSIDFYCVEAKLAIEVDGVTHGTPEAKQYDARRQRFIESFGVRFVRVTNDDVYENMEGVIGRIVAAIGKTPPVSPLGKGGAVAPGSAGEKERRAVSPRRQERQP